MFPWQTLITGAVGVAGIGGTILAARMTSKSQTANLKPGIGAENERARRAEKRLIYARCLASYEAMLTQVLVFRDAGDRAESLDERSATEMSAVVSAMNVVVAELMLIAPC